MFNNNMKKIEDFLSLDIEVGDLVKSVVPSMSHLHGVVTDIDAKAPYSISVRWNKSNLFNIYLPVELIVVSPRKQTEA
tara:strand:+ start:543 stop:776 length:234 start_codon:yes stop_codon:yes gene_type:complete